MTLLRLATPKDFGTNDTTDSDWRDPHDSVDHLHNHFVNHLEESDDRLCLATDGSENCAESEAEEDDAKCVGAAPVCEDLLVLGGVGGRVQLLFILRPRCLESCLEEVIRDHAPAEVEEVVHDLDLPLRLVTRPHHCLDLRAARMDDDYEDKSDRGRQQGGEREKSNCSHCN